MVVSQATQLNFSGATITSGSTGVANITITPGGSSPFIDATPNNSVVNDYYSPSDVDGENSQLIGGIGNYITSDGKFNSVIGGRTSYIAGLAPNTNISGNTIVGSSASYIDLASTTWPGFNGIYSAQNAYINGAAWGATIMGGVDNYITHSPFAIVLGGQSNRVYGAVGDTFHASRGAIVGGFNNYITESSPKENSGIFSSVGCYISETANSVIVGTSSSYISNSDNSGIFQARTSNIQNTPDCAIIGGHSNNIAGGTEGIIAGGYSNSLASADGSIYGGRGNYAFGSTYRSTIVGGIYNYINGVNAGSIIEGGHFNLIDATSSRNFGNSDMLGIWNSDVCNITGLTFSKQVGILSSSATTIADSQFTTTLGAVNTSVSGKTNVVMIGTSGRTADEDFTTYVENLKAFGDASVENLKVSGEVEGQIKYGNYNNGSQSTGYNLNWDNGNIQKLTLTGNLAFSATNISDGTTYILKLVQDGSGNRTATWTSSQFEWPNGTAPTLSTGANDVDIITFVAMDGVLYGVAQKNFS